MKNFFRAGGSYLYNQLAENKNIIGFYEPFHDVFNNSENYKTEEKEFKIKTKKLKHFSDEFYFKNYPINSDWFIKFHKDFSPFKLFEMNRGNENELKNYLKNLINYAHNIKMTPLLKINRLYFNPNIINLDKSFNIFIFRNPVSSFFSNISLNLLTPYYELIDYFAKKKIKFFEDLQNFAISQNLKSIQIKDGNILFYDKNQMESHFSIFFLIWFYGLEQNLKRHFYKINYDKLTSSDYKLKIKSFFREKIKLELNLDSFKKNQNKLYETPLTLNDDIRIILYKFFDKKYLKNFSKNNNIEYLSSYL